MLFVDKYRPKSLDELHYHQDLSDRLRSLVSRSSTWVDDATLPSLPLLTFLISLYLFSLPNLLLVASLLLALISQFSSLRLPRWSIQAGHEDFPHLLFYGPAGAGKKTRVMALMKELYGPGALKVSYEMLELLIRKRMKALGREKMR